jgi:serine/threonine-protein kinase
LPITIRIVSQAAAGLHAAHELRDEGGNLLSLVHRDASPQNILVTFDGVVKVVDFGIAKAVGRGTADTNAGQIKGKAAYMAPEQVKGNQLDRRTDVFALGTILYFMTTGRHPFRGENDVATLYNISSDTPVMLPSKLNRHFPLSLEAVVMKALAKNPRDRFSSAHELQRALDMALPASQRLTTDAEVAAFMHSLLNERHEQRKTALKMALRVADERGHGRSSVPPMPTSDSGSHSGFTPPSNVSGLIAPKEFQPRPDAPSDPSHASAAQSVAGVTTPTDRWGILSGGRVSGGARVAFAVGSVALALVTGLFVAAKLASHDSAPGPVVAAPAVAVNPPSSAPPAVPAAASSAADIDTAHVDSVDPPDKAAVSPDAQSAQQKWVPHAPPHPPGKPVVVATQPSAPPKPPSTAFVPPVRNPGF